MPSSSDFGYRSSRIRAAIASALRRCSVGAIVLVPLVAASVACTVKEAQKPEPGGSAGSGPSSSSGGGEAAGTSNRGNDAGSPAREGGGGAAGASTQKTEAGSPGAAGSTGSKACGDVGAEGICTGDVVEYCSDGELVSIDCGQVNATCEVTGDEAVCADLIRAAACGELTPLGTCDGNVMRYCDESGAVGVARSINCAAWGRVCDPKAGADGGADCISHGACPSDVDENGVCSDNELRFCEANADGDSELFVFDCGLDECRQVDDFSDCFAADFEDGCGSVTAEGTCIDGSVNRCLGNVVAREDCQVLGLECEQGDGGASCQRGACPAECVSGFTCTDGLCVADTTPEREWTIAVYSVADNNLSDALWQDLNEMEEVGSGDDLEVLLQIEFSDTFSSSVPSDYRTGAYRMVVTQDSADDSSASLEAATDLGDDVNMGSSATLTEFLRWAAENHPARRMALILANHGLGYQGGFFDTGSDSSMDLRELVAGVRDSGVHLDLLGMDACMLGMHEVGMALRGVADIMVASEEVEPGAGWPYDEILKTLQATPTLSASELGEAVVTSYADAFSSGLRARSATMATFDLATLPALNDRLADFTRTVLTQAPGKRTDIKTAVASNDLMRSQAADITDLGSILDVFSQEDPFVGPIATSATDVNAWFEESNAVLSVRGTRNKEGTSGLGIYFPEVAWSQYSSKTYGTYQASTSFLPLQPWLALVGSLSASEESAQTPGEGAVDSFSVILTWGDEAGGTQSSADLDLYVYEPNGEFGTPANGSTTTNGLLSADSYDTELSTESYELQPEHQAGTYIILVSLYFIPEGDQAFPRLQIYRDDLPGGSRTLVRGKVVDRELVEIPMDDSSLLDDTISADNFQDVLDLEYSNLWYATTIEVSAADEGT
ncbi:MAG: hypothetical protein JW940_12810 [Polyangiaceae bacterium]|nr:hypothetical protein [Polyangiaceae bacterium]